MPDTPTTTCYSSGSALLSLRHVVLEVSWCQLCLVRCWYAGAALVIILTTSPAARSQSPPHARESPCLRIRSCAPVAAMPPSRAQPRLATWPATLAILLLGAALASAAAAQVNQNDRKTLEGKVIIIG